MKILSSVNLFFIIFTLSFAAPAANFCSQVLIGVSDQGLTSTIENLASLKLRLEQAKAIGADSISVIALKYDFGQKESLLINELESKHIMTAAELKQKMTSVITKLQKRQDPAAEDKKRKKQSEEINILNEYAGAKAVFLKLKGFKAKKLSLMQTHVTQMQYARIQILLGETDPKKINPSYFVNGDSGIEIVIDGHRIKMQAKNPVENISWDDAVFFIDALNKLSRNGDESVQNKLAQIIADHKKGDIYNLPSLSVWNYVMSNSTSISTSSPWFQNKSDSQTHPVGQLPGRTIGSAEFFDLEGNVWQWAEDTDSNPKNRIEAEERWARGGSFLSNPGDDSQESFEHDYKANNIGFRLIRLGS